MSTSYLVGYLLVFAGGVLQGTFMLPMKFTKRWAWENTWLVFSTAAYLLWPWSLALLTLPHLGAIYAGTSGRTLLLIGLFGLGWGLGTLTFGLGVDRLGLALGFAVILGLTTAAGSFVPLLVLAPEKLREPQGQLIIGALLLVLVGIGLCARAGGLRAEGGLARQSVQHSSYVAGLVICIVSGLLSACANFGFTFGSEVVQNALSQGAPPSMAGNSLWALITLPLFFCNGMYCAWLMKKKGTGGLLWQSGTGYHWVLALLMGAFWIGGFVCYAAGTRRLGSLGTSVGWAIMMSAMVITANFWGLLTGEWKGADRKAKRILFVGVAILVAAIGVVGYANY